MGDGRVSKRDRETERERERDIIFMEPEEMENGRRLTSMKFEHTIYGGFYVLL